MKPLIALEPVTLFSAADEPKAAALASDGDAGRQLAETDVAGTRFAVRCGRRVIGVRPQFPSADLVVAVQESSGWRDVAFVDEPLEGTVEQVRIAMHGGKVRATYRVRDAAGAAVGRAVELAWPEPKGIASGWTALPAYPIARGVAGIIAGTHGGVLIAAGGANFPAQPPWEGGKKAYYDEIFVLAPGETEWRAAGRLPERRAYSAVVSLPQGVLVAGGENADTVFSSALWLRWDGTNVAVDPAPALPAPVTSPAAAVLEGRVYLAGGYAPGPVRESRADFWSFDPGQPSDGWKKRASWPGPARGLAVMAALEGAIYLVSGLEVVTGADGKAQSTYLRDAYRYRRGTWERLPDLPWSTIAAPSPAPITTQPARVFVAGGVDGRQVGRLPRATRVPEDILYFDVARHAWRLWPERWVDPVVTSPAVPLGDAWIIVSGETMAGVRTASTWAWRISNRP